MKPKPTRPFIIIWTLLIIVFLGGLVVAFILSQQICCAPPSGPSATETAFAESYQTQPIVTRNSTLTPYNASMSPTVPFRPSHTPSSTRFRPSHTPSSTFPPYDASMSPTAPLPPAQLTYWAATMAARALTPSLTPSSTSSVHDSNCAFMWARQDLPAVTSLVQTALDDAGIAYVTARAEAYGENCYRQDGSVSYFAAMTTDFYLNIPLENLADEEFMGQLVAAAYRMLVAIPEDSLPARLGYLDITFTAGGQSKRFRTMFDQLKPLIEAGANPATLLEVGGGLR